MPLKDKDKRKERQRQYQLTHAKEIKEYKRQYYLTHAEAIKEYRLTHAKEIKELRRRYYLAHRIEEIQRAILYGKTHGPMRYARYKSQGLCVKCGKEAVPFRTCCLHHLDLRASQGREYWLTHKELKKAYQEKWRKRMEDEGRCKACGRSLIEGDGKTCIFCSSGLPKRRIYATHFETAT